MKVSVALGVAVAALTVAAASAQSSSRHVIVRGGHSSVEIDADDDGWITRAEASSAFERIFDDLDSNDDGKLDSADRREIAVHVDGPDVRVLEGGDGRRVRVITRDGEEVDEEDVEREIERAMEAAERAMERAERDADRAERHAERAAREAERHAERAEREAERHVERHIFRSSEGGHNVIIVRTDGDDGEWTRLSELDDLEAIAPVAPVPPTAPVPPVPAMGFMMLVANSEEADRNGDGALSRDEFLAQHLRFFDASDANGDGRVRFERPPAPPEPPAPPAPPEPPRRR